MTLSPSFTQGVATLPCDVHLRGSWGGATDGSVMGAGNVLGADPVPPMVLSSRVGGPFASIRAEVASLLQRSAVDQFGHSVHLLEFFDCVVLLDILTPEKVGKSQLPSKAEGDCHFGVIRPLLVDLRQWIGKLVLMKVKSHLIRVAY